MSSPQIQVRKLVTIVEETRSEMGQSLAGSFRKAAAAAVINNPNASSYFADLQPLIDAGEQLGSLLGRAARVALGVLPEEVESYGKAAIVGEAGELEHGHAILHPKFGTPLRNECGGVEICKAIIPSAVKLGNPGSVIDVPLHYKRAAFVRSHYDAMEVRVPDAPKRNEIVVIAVLSNNGRPLARIGGLTKLEAKGTDGLR
jgi:hypothetical protein